MGYVICACLNRQQSWAKTVYPQKTELNTFVIRRPVTSFIYIYIHIYIYMCVCMHVYIYMYVRVCVHEYKEKTCWWTPKCIGHYLTVFKITLMKSKQTQNILIISTIEVNIDMFGPSKPEEKRSTRNILSSVILSSPLYYASNCPRRIQLQLWYTVWNWDLANSPQNSYSEMTFSDKMSFS